MPHVVLQGKIDARTVHEHWAPLMVRHGQAIHKAQEAYLSTTGREVIVDALVIEPPEQQAFLVNITTRDDGVVVRLHPKVEAERTPGVQRLLAAVAHQLMATHEGVAVGETNLHAFLEELAATAPR